jgi:hypothetical protein
MLMLRTLCLIAALVSFGGMPLMAQEPIINPASNEDPTPGEPGEKPYEMADREEPRAPLVAFEDVSGWVVEGHNAEGWLYLTREQRLFRETSAKLVYVGRGAPPTLLVRPEEPIPIPEPWDSINFWNYGNGWGWAPDASTPFLGVSVVLRDASGWEFDMPMGRMDY